MAKITMLSTMKTYDTSVQVVCVNQIVHSLIQTPKQYVIYEIVTVCNDELHYKGVELETLELRVFDTILPLSDRKGQTIGIYYNDTEPEYIDPRETDALVKKALKNQIVSRRSTPEPQAVPESTPSNSASLSFEIIDYSERAFAVFGDTIQIKEELSDLKGTYNKFLKKDVGKSPGWIFSKRLKEKVETYLKSKYHVVVR